MTESTMAFDAAAMLKDRLAVLIAEWEQASREDETGADTFRNGYLAGQNWAASSVRELLADVEAAEFFAESDAKFRDSLREGRF